MNIWGVLEIEPTDEISAIKKAYAKKLKIYHPEDDPEGYQRLRECYEAALKLAKNNALREAAVLEEDVLEDEADEDQAYEDQTDLHKNEEYEDNSFSKVNIFDEHVALKDSSQQLIEEFFDRVDELYEDFFRRIELKSWEGLLDCDILWNLEWKNIINNKMLNFLMTHHHIPKNIWQFLNRNFHWDEQESYLKSCCHKNFLQYLYNQLDEESVSPRYCYFSSTYEIDYDKYLDYRDEANNSLADNDLVKARRCISLAYEMYSLDPDLLCIEGEYYLRIKEKDKANKSFLDAIKINYKDLDLRFYIALIYSNSSYPYFADEICKFILQKNPDYFEARLLLGKRYIKSKRWYDADEVFLVALKMKPSDPITINCLNIVKRQLYITYEKHHMNYKVRSYLKKTYAALGEYDQIKNMKITFKDILKVFLYVLLFIAIILAFFGSGGTALPAVFVFFAIRAAFGNKKKAKVKKESH